MARKVDRNRCEICYGLPEFKGFSGYLRPYILVALLLGNSTSSYVTSPLNRKYCSFDSSLRAIKSVKATSFAKLTNVRFIRRAVSKKTTEHICLGLKKNVGNSQSYGRFAISHDSTSTLGVITQPHDLCPSKDPTSNLPVRSDSRIPPWIAKHVEQLHDSNRYTIFEAHAKHSLRIARSVLEDHVIKRRERYKEASVDVSALSGDGAIREEDIDDIINAIIVAGKNVPTLISGAAEFICLICSMEQYPHDKYNQLSRYDWSGGAHFERVFSYDYLSINIVSKNILIASAFHYVDCVLAREGGLYEMVRNLIYSTGKDGAVLSKSLLESSETRRGKGNEQLCSSVDNSNHQNMLENCSVQVLNEIPFSKLRQPTTSIEQFSEDVIRIVEVAGRIKSTEVMAEAILPYTASTVTPSPVEANNLRSLILTTVEDWRALVIRCVASLYRVRGISHHLTTSMLFDDTACSKDPRNAQIVRTAREALYVYAPLAQQLGLYRLKSEIEDISFGILYKKQYQAANTLYGKSDTGLQSVTQFLTETIETMLRSDHILSSQLDYFEVKSRVKQPYSLWRKIIRQRFKMIKENQNKVKSPDRITDLSVTNVLDCVALRVVLRARKLYATEDEVCLENRGKMLCYYVFKVLSDVFVATDANRVKDYISSPKRNGYMSIHYTSSLNRYGHQWPFEIQIRTEEMHRMAEFGLAAHWDYKINGANGESSSDVIGLSQILSHSMTSAEMVCQGSTANSLAPRPQMEAYIDSLLSSRENFIVNNLFLFITPSDSALDGKIMMLKKGSTVRDALRQVEELYKLDLKSYMTSNFDDILLNGNHTDWGTCISNGDLLKLPPLEGLIKKKQMKIVRTE